MAVLNKIRERSIFLIIIIALALFAFVLADVIRNGGFSGGKNQNEVAVVNGESIDRTEFARDVENYQQRLGPNASSMQAVNLVYESKLRELILEEQFEELGIEVSQEQIRAQMATQLAGNPTFSDEEGNFSAAKLQEYVANIKASSPQAYQQWLSYEEQVAQAAKEEMYFNLIKAGLGATLLEGEQAYLMANNSVDLEFVQIPYTSVEEKEAQVSKDEIAAYIKKNPKKYTVEAGRDIQYVLFNEQASLEDETELKSQLTSLINEFRSTDDNEAFVNTNSDQPYNPNYRFKNQLPATIADSLFNLEEGDVFGPYKDGNYFKISKLIETKRLPDSAKASHILISYSGLQTATNVERTEEEAKTLADSLLTELNRDKSKFATFAGAYSADQSNAPKGGDLGYFTPGQMVPAFNDYVFENNEGDMGIVKTRFGYHIINITEQTDKEQALKLATVSSEIEASEKTTNNLFSETTKFEIAAKNGDFSEIAKENEYSVRPVKGIKALDENIPGVGRQRSIVNWAFNEETEIGDIKRFDVPQGYVVAQVTGSNEKGLMNIEDAAVTVTPIIKNQKKADIIKAKISGSTLEAIATNQNTTVKTSNALNMTAPTLAGAGNEPKVVGAAFALNEGELSQPIAGKNGVYVVKVVKRNNATDLGNYKAFAAQETAKRTQAVNSQVYKALKESAEIDDNRAAFY